MEKIKFKEYLKERVKHKFFVSALAVYVLFCIASAIYFCATSQWQSALLSVGYIAIALLFFILEYLIGFRCGELFTVLILLLAVGGLTGACYNLYTIIPFFDSILHGMSGLLFGCVGFTIANKFFGDENDNRSFFGKVLFAFCFSLAIAVVWEIFEYTCSSLFGFDMMEDTYVDSINSYLLAGSHSETVNIEGIVKTVIYYGDGQTYVIDGYLDLGLIDTITDMIICTIGATIFIITAIISYFKYPKINETLIPKVINKKISQTPNSQSANVFY